MSLEKFEPNQIVKYIAGSTEVKRRSRMLTLFLKNKDGKKKYTVHFNNYLFETSDPEVIKLMDNFLEDCKLKGIPKPFLRYSEWETLRNLEPQLVTLEIDGEKYKVELEDLKKEFREKIKNKKTPETNEKQTVVTGTKGTMGGIKTQ